MGGLPPWPSFDSIANVKARALGYETRLVTDLVAIQIRETASRYGHAAGYARKGRYAWFLVFTRCGRRAPPRPIARAGRTTRAITS